MPKIIDCFVDKTDYAAHLKATLQQIRNRCQQLFVKVNLKDVSSTEDGIWDGSATHFLLVEKVSTKILRIIPWSTKRILLRTCQTENFADGSPSKIQVYIHDLTIEKIVTEEFESYVKVTGRDCIKIIRMIPQGGS